MHSDTCTSLVSLVQCLLHFDSGTGIPATLWVCITLSYIVTSFATCDLFHWSSDIFFPKLNMVDLNKIIKITRSETHQIPAGFFTHLKVFRVRKNHRIFGPRIFSPCQTCRAKGLLDVFIFQSGTPSPIRSKAVRLWTQSSTFQRQSGGRVLNPWQSKKTQQDMVQNGYQINTESIPNL